MLEDVLRHLTDCLGNDYRLILDDCEKNQRTAINARILEAIGARRRLDAVNRLFDGVEIEHRAPARPYTLQ